MLAVITPFSIIGVGVLVLLFIFVILPRIIGSKKIDKLNQDLTTDTTSKIVDKFENAKDGLEQKSKEAVQTIKDATSESKVINKVLGKKDEE